MKLHEFFSADEVRRDADFSVTLHPQARVPGAICYALKEAVLLRINRNPCIAAVITTEALAGKVAEGKGIAVVSNPQDSYYRLHNHLFKKGLMEPHHEASVDPSADVASTVVLGRHVIIGAGVTIGHGSIIGDYTIIGEGTYVGEHVLLGARGMQNTRVDGRFTKIEWAGGVRIGRNCEILAAAIIQRPYHCEYTEIGDEARISVKVNIGHGVLVGTRTVIAGNAQVAGNTRIGSDVWIGPSATIADGLRIGDRAEIKIGSVVIRNVAEREVISGNFAFSHERHIEETCRRIHE